MIHSDNAIDHHEEDGSLVSRTEFTLGRAPTIFSTEDQWILNRDNEVPQVITVSNDGQAMTLSDNVYDGFGRAYARSR